MTEIKPWQDRVKPGAFTGVKMEAMLAEIAEHRAAKVEQGKPVAWFIDVTTNGESTGDWQVAAREHWGDLSICKPLFTRPVRPMSGEPVLGTKTWMEGGVVMTQNLTASDIYKPVPMTEDEFITAVEASGIEVDNVEAAFAIKRIVELFHGIKGATE